MDIIKVRLQTTPIGTYRGPWDCFVQLARKESLFGLYKGASPVAVSWSISDAILMGTLHNLRLVFSRWTGAGGDSGRSLHVGYHALAGLGAGWTNSLVQAPAENLKTLLQVQTQRVGFTGAAAAATAAASAQAPLFTGPIDAAKGIVHHHGITGMWRTLPATLMFRSSFAVVSQRWRPDQTTLLRLLQRAHSRRTIFLPLLDAQQMFGSFELISKGFASLKGTSFEVSPGVATFLSGGLAAEFFWLSAFPCDSIKGLMQSDTPGKLKYPRVRDAWREIWWNRAGPSASVFRRIRLVYTGFAVVLLRAFPTNASSIWAYETAMGLMRAEKTTTT